MKTYEIRFIIGKIIHTLLIDGLDAEEVETVFFDAYAQDYDGEITILTIKQFITGD